MRLFHRLGPAGLRNEARLIDVKLLADRIFLGAGIFEHGRCSQEVI